MFIHIGNNNVIRSREIISIVDHNLITSSSVMEEMIYTKRKQNETTGPKSIAKSIIITSEMIYFSSLSVLTLKKRSGIASMINKSKEYEM